MRHVRPTSLALFAFPLLAACGAQSDEVRDPELATTTEALNPLASAVRDGDPIPGLVAPVATPSCTYCAVTPSSMVGAPVATAGDALESYAPGIADWAAASGLRPTYGATATEGASYLKADPGDPKSAFNSIQGNLESAKVLFDDLCSTLPTGCTVTLAPPTPTSWSRAFPRIDGRQRIAGYVKDSYGFDTLETYPAAPDMAELRMRGARMYCGTRQAAIAQQAASAYGMTDTSVLEFLLWRIGVAQSGVKILPGVKNVADKESEVFALPIALSGRIAPVDGPLMPDFGEMSHTMVWMTGDREMLSRESFGSIKDGICIGTGFLGGRCIPLPKRNGFRDFYRNMEHIDVLAGTGAKGHLTVSDVPIIEYGFFALKAGATFDIDSGFVDDSADLGKGRVAFPGGAGVLLPRPGDAAVPTFASDAPLVLNGTYFIPVEGGATPYAPWQALPGSAPRTRYGIDDDRSVVVADRVDTAVTLTAMAGFSLGPVNASIDAHSRVDAWVQQSIAVREQLGLADGALLLPTTAANHVSQTNLVFTPSSQFGITIDPLTLTLKFGLHMHVDLGITSFDIDFDWSTDLLSVAPLTFPADPKVATEGERMRIGTFSEQNLGSLTDPTREHPSVASHLPNATAFASFPAGTDVKSCLAAPPSELPPPPEKPRKPTGPETRALCIDGLQPLQVNGSPPGPGMPADVCTNQAVRDAFAASFADASDFAAADPVQRTKQRAAEIDCAKNAVDLLCAPTSKRLSTVKGDILSHVLVPAEGAVYGNVKAQCINAFAMGGTDEASAKAIGELAAKRILDVRSCAPDGTPTTP